MGDKGFYVVGLGGEHHFEALHTTTGASMHGIVLDKKIENTVSVLMDPGTVIFEPFAISHADDCDRRRSRSRDIGNNPSLFNKGIKSF